MMQLRWGIIGTGAIGRHFAKALRASNKNTLSAVASRTRESANKFAEKFECVPFGSYQEILDSSEVDIVYVATPHPQHAEWAIKAARAGKHVLCEKPLGLNQAEAMAIFDAAEQHGVFAMEAFMYRCHPQTEKVASLIADGAIGEPRLVEASFGFNAPFDAESRLFSADLGGGGIMDVGCYPVSFSRLVAGVTEGRRYANPTNVTGTVHLGQSGVDEWAAATLAFDSGLIAQVSTSVSVTLPSDVKIYGSTGQIHVPHPWHPVLPDQDSAMFALSRAGQNIETIKVPVDRDLFTIEADCVADAISAGKKECAQMAWSDTLGNLQTLDAWRQTGHFTFPIERPSAGAPPYSGMPLSVSGSDMMPARSLPHIQKPVSRLVMGCDNQETMPQAAAMFDAFFESGGTCFDTAFIYGRGIMEKLLGHWHKARDVRNDIHIIGKGAHSPDCYPHIISKQLDKSLNRLQTDYVDLYFLHRDNLDVPVGEFVDALNKEVSDGRIKSFGGSNWSQARIDEANAYAQKQGLQGFDLVSNNFSLARMENPVWPGCIAASDDPFRTWLEGNEVALFCWSSQARGFFTDRAGADLRDDPELVNAWYSEANFERRRRAYQLAEELGVEAVHIALAYVTAQKFEPFALIGPRSLSEMRSSFRALSVALTPQQIAWLDLRSDER